jgi:hypothetical protein
MFRGRKKVDTLKEAKERRTREGNEGINEN